MIEIPASITGKCFLHSARDGADDYSSDCDTGITVYNRARILLLPSCDSIQAYSQPAVENQACKRCHFPQGSPCPHHQKQQQPHPRTFTKNKTQIPTPRRQYPIRREYDIFTMTSEPYTPHRPASSRIIPGLHPLASSRNKANPTPLQQRIAKIHTRSHLGNRHRGEY